MCLEFAWKKAGIPLVRNFYHGTHAVAGYNPKELIIEGYQKWQEKDSHLDSTSELTKMERLSLILINV